MEEKRGQNLDDEAKRILEERIRKVREISKRASPPPVTEPPPTIPPPESPPRTFTPRVITLRPGG